MSIEFTLSRLEHAGYINVFDRKLSLFMQTLAGETHELMLISVALLSQAVSQGHVCLELSDMAGRPMRDDKGVIFHLPDSEEWLRQLQTSSLLISDKGVMPLLLDSGKLYLQKYHWHEKQLAEMISTRLQGRNSGDLSPDVVALLDSLFPVLNETDWQWVAAVAALVQNFCIITGGPGTGKTTTVVKILALLLQNNCELSIAMAAPTGKAAARLQDSVNAARSSLNCDDAVRQRIPQNAVTVHRLLGWMPDGQGFKYNRSNQLDLDVLIVDEVSMIDMLLMARLMAAVPAQAKIIFLGDPDQLASVEAGSVLAELTRDTGKFSPDVSALLKKYIPGLPEGESKADSRLADAVIALQKSHRFTGHGILGRFALAINSGDAGSALSLLTDEPTADVIFNRGHAEPTLVRELVRDAVECYQVYIESVRTGKEKADIFAAFDRYRVLCVRRVGLSGADEINRLIENALFAGHQHVTDAWYIGRPVMVSKNMPEQRLYNGDVGICLESEKDTDALAVYFPQGDGSFRAYATPRLATVSTVFAMTIHKSQGSEFDSVGLMLGTEAASITRELIYTGVTRAKQSVRLYGALETFEAGVKKPTRRYSGLRQRIEALAV